MLRHVTRWRLSFLTESRFWGYLYVCVRPVKQNLQQQSTQGIQGIQIRPFYSMLTHNSEDSEVKLVKCFLQDSGSKKETKQRRKSRKNRRWADYEDESVTQ